MLEGWLATCGTSVVMGRQKAPGAVEVAPAFLVAKGRPHHSRMSLLKVSWLLRLTLLLSTETKVNPTAHKDIGGHAYVPLLLCLLGTLILSRPVQQYLNQP